MCFKSPADQKIGYVPGGLTPNEVVQQHSNGDLLPNSLPVGGTDEARPSSLPGKRFRIQRGIAPQIQNGRTGCSGFMTLAIETSHRETNWLNSLFAQENTGSKMQPRYRVRARC